MAVKVTRDILEAFLNCKLKGHLKLAGQHGVATEYAKMRTEIRQALRAAEPEWPAACRRVPAGSTSAGASRADGEFAALPLPESVLEGRSRLVDRVR